MEIQQPVVFLQISSMGFSILNVVPNTGSIVLVPTHPLFIYPCGDDGVANTLHLLLLLVELLNLDKLVGVQPLDGLIALVDDSLLVVFADLVLDLVVIESGLHVEAVALKSLLSRNPLLLANWVGFSSPHFPPQLLKPLEITKAKVAEANEHFDFR